MTADVQSAVLVYLRENPDGASIKEIAEATGCSATAVRNNLLVISRTGFYGGDPWVKVVNGAGIKAGIWSLTDDGERVAGYRATTAKRNA